MNKAKDPLFNIVKRDALPWYKSLGIRLIAILAALIVCAIVTTILTGICLHLFRGVRNGQKDMDYISECGNFAVDFAGIDTGIPDALLEHRGRGTGAGRRSGGGSLHDHTGRQGAKCSRSTADGRMQSWRRCHLGTDPGLL